MTENSNQRCQVLTYLAHGEVSGEQVNEFKKEAGWQEVL